MKKGFKAIKVFAGRHRNILFTGLILGLFLFTVDSFSAYKFLNGEDWEKIDCYGLSPREEAGAKALFLKSAYEAGLLNGAPLFTLDPASLNYKSDFYKYAVLVDKFTCPVAVLTKTKPVVDENVPATPPPLNVGDGLDAFEQYGVPV